MAFPIPLASKMSGASVEQLAYWRKTNVLIPEIESSERPYLYSFRDIVALRTFAWLRGDHSLQLIRQALATLREMDLVDHPSTYKLVKLGRSIGVHHPGAEAIDVGREPGQAVIGTFAQVFAEFETVNKRRVDPLLRPRVGVEVNPGRLGGWPTIVGTRVPYDVVASLIDDGSVSPEDVGAYYPGVTASAALDALDYERSVHGEAA
ncbi:DUF433 domain-containing protein [Leifsonia shinshuensis]|uniref:Uncharacterized protein (DUF433 family) n=1 Tax=Leifsonia shinshuensis TaxID=150026 RepID=A0A853D2C2_9MICO|nr:DUF433 domain-containing protein [Leifsonia shinshuensis]NYJ25591.1 uncharacterized protein (DUF433 family) [Leifsonia shinshuensis]